MTGAEQVFVRSVPATPDNVSALRHAVTDLARRVGAGARAQGDVALALGEACGNVVVHAYAPDEVGAIVVEARAAEGEMVVVVSDHGRGMKPHPDTRGLGLGLPLRSSLASRMTIAEGPAGRGTEVRMTFVLDPE
jgi:serine/threonine-protein kinase RsbW